MPSIRAAAVGITEVDGTPVSADTLLTPCLSILPMGWSWAPFFCQEYLVSAVDRASLEDSVWMRDGGEPAVIDNGHKLALGGYLDNFIVVGHCRIRVTAALQKIVRTLQGQGMVVHEVQAASLHNEFVGIEFRGQGHVVAVRARRIWKLRAALRAVVRRGTCSPKTMEVLVGHITWSCLLRREALSILSAVYVFSSLQEKRPNRIVEKCREGIESHLSLVTTFAN